MKSLANIMICSSLGVEDSAILCRILNDTVVGACVWYAKSMASMGDIII